MAKMRLAKRPLNFKEESKTAVKNKGKKGIPVLSERIAPSGRPLEEHFGTVDRRPAMKNKPATNPIRAFADALVRRSKKNELLKKLRKNPQSEFSNPSRGRRIM